MMIPLALLLAAQPGQIPGPSALVVTESKEATQAIRKLKPASPRFADDAELAGFNVRQTDYGWLALDRRLYATALDTAQAQVHRWIKDRKGPVTIDLATAEPGVKKAVAALLRQHLPAAYADEALRPPGRKVAFVPSMEGILTDGKTEIRVVADGRDDALIADVCSGPALSKPASPAEGATATPTGKPREEEAAESAMEVHFLGGSVDATRRIDRTFEAMGWLKELRALELDRRRKAEEDAYASWAGEGWTSGREMNPTQLSPTMQEAFVGRLMGNMGVNERQAKGFLGRSRLTKTKVSIMMVVGWPKDGGNHLVGSGIGD